MQKKQIYHNNNSIIHVRGQPKGPVSTVGGKLFLAASLIERPIKKLISNKRINAFNGQWKGMLHQKNEPETPSVDFEFRCDFKIEGAKITSTGSFNYENRNTTILIKVFPTDSPSVIKFDYVDEKPEISRYGTGYCQLSSTGDSANLQAIAYGSEVERLVHVTGELNKTNQ